MMKGKHTKGATRNEVCVLLQLCGDVNTFNAVLGADTEALVRVIDEMVSRKKHTQNPKGPVFDRVA